MSNTTFALQNRIYTVNTYVIAVLILVCLLQSSCLPINDNDLKEINCREQQLNSSDCLQQNILFYLRRLKHGLREAEVPSLDPLNIDISHFFTDNDKEKLLLNLTVTNIQIRGLTSLDISHINLNQEDGKVEIFGKIPLIVVEMDLESEGGILFFPIHGEGHLKLNLYDVSSALMMYYSDKKMVIVSKFMSDFTPSKIIAKFKGTVDDDSTLGESVNTFLNENSYELYGDSKSVILQNLDKIFCKIINDALFYYYVRREQNDLYHLSET